MSAELCPDPNWHTQSPPEPAAEGKCPPARLSRKASIRQPVRTQGYAPPPWERRSATGTPSPPPLGLEVGQRYPHPLPQSAAHQTGSFSELAVAPPPVSGSTRGKPQPTSGTGIREMGTPLPPPSAGHKAGASGRPPSARRPSQHRGAATPHPLPPFTRTRNSLLLTFCRNRSILL